jgi:hypothetical protein
MAETVRFTIGAKTSCSDGTCGEVTRVIVDPVAEAVTQDVQDLPSVDVDPPQGDLPE